MKRKSFLGFVTTTGCANLRFAFAPPNKDVNKLNINPQKANNIVNEIITTFRGEASILGTSDKQHDTVIKAKGIEFI
jgi:hypothetical protein